MSPRRPGRSSADAASFWSWAVGAALWLAPAQAATPPPAPTTLAKTDLLKVSVASTAKPTEVRPTWTYTFVISNGAESGLEVNGLNFLQKPIGAAVRPVGKLPGNWRLDAAKKDSTLAITCPARPCLIPGDKLTVTFESNFAPATAVGDLLYYSSARGIQSGHFQILVPRFAQQDEAAKSTTTPAPPGWTFEDARTRFHASRLDAETRKNPVTARKGCLETDKARQYPFAVVDVDALLKRRGEDGAFEVRAVVVAPTGEIVRSLVGYRGDARPTRQRSATYMTRLPSNPLPGAYRFDELLIKPASGPEWRPRRYAASFTVQDKCP